MLAAELALEQGRPDDACEQVEQALALVAGTDDEVYRSEMCTLGGARPGRPPRADAGVDGRPVDVDKARLLARDLVQEADRLVAATG